MMHSVMIKYNEAHDERGRFTTGGGGGGGSVLGDKVLPTQSIVLSVPIPAGRGRSEPKDIEVLINPKERDISSMAREALDNAVRSIVDAHGNLFVWRGDEAIHSHVAKALHNGGVNFDEEDADWITGGDTWYVRGRIAPAFLAQINAIRKRALEKFNENHDEKGRFTTGSGDVASVVDQHKSLAEQSLSSPLTTDEKNAIYSYTTVANRPINSVLRQGTDQLKLGEQLKANIRNLDRALAKSELAQPITVYRHLTEASYNRMATHMGGEFVDKGFLSTTTDATHPYYRYQPPHMTGYAAEISLPKGAKALPIAHITSEGRADEAEVLVNRGSHFKIEKSTSGRPKAIKLTWVK